MSSEKLSLSPTDLGWLAGLLEGEGCFHYHDTPRVLLQMTDKDIVERASVLMKCPSIRAGTRRPQPHHKQMWATAVAGLQAIYVMQAVRPLMGERRGSKIDEVLACDVGRQGGCSTCGKELTGQRNQRYCSQHCRYKANYIPRSKRDSQGSV